MNISKQPITYGAIALTSLSLWGSYAKLNQAQQLELATSQPFITSTLSKPNVSQAANRLLSTKECLDCDREKDRLAKTDLENVVMADADSSEANISRVDLTRINLEKTNLRYILMLEVTFIGLIIAYTFLRLP